MSIINKKKIVIIGNGISAKCIIFELAQKYKDSPGSVEIIQIASDEFAPRCTTRTTAINCIRGTQRDVSPLGNAILDSYTDFKDWYHIYSPRGVEPTTQVHFWRSDSKRYDLWLRRFKTYRKADKWESFTKDFNKSFCYFESEAYMFVPEIFCEWLDSNSSIEKTLINDYVVEIDNKDADNIQVKTQNGLLIEADYICLCTSYMTKNFDHLVESDERRFSLNNTKPVDGTYLKFKQSDFNAEEFDFSKSFSLVFEKSHLIYRKLSGEVLIGATSRNDSMNFMGDMDGIQEHYDHLVEELNGCINMPDFDKAEVLVGIRHKGHRRMPYWGVINKNIYAVWGLYKNAFTMCFSASKDFINSLPESFED